MKRLFFGLLLLLTACVPASESQVLEADIPQYAVSLPDLGPAPELSNDTWLNVESPLRLADLRGKVVALEMWTFGCYNCQNVLPSLKEWHSKFSFEESLDSLKAAVLENGIEYAVAQDNDGKTWRAYENRYWPTLYLIDKAGHIRYIHIGEGRYKETEAAIQLLLAEPYPAQ